MVPRIQTHQLPASCRVKKFFAAGGTDRIELDNGGSCQVVLGRFSGTNDAVKVVCVAQLCRNGTAGHRVSARCGLFVTLFLFKND